MIRRGPFSLFQKLSGALAFSVLALPACTTHHWAQVESAQLPPPPGEKVVHTGRVIVQLTEETTETQCVAYERYSPVCFYNVRPALEAGLARTLWPSFPEVVLGEPKDVGPSDYLLQVEVTLDALPPDDAGPGWSAGARSRYRLIREGKVLTEETLASRSRAVFPYGAPLGDGASEVVDATIIHIAQKIGQFEEARPDAALPLPKVAAKTIPAPKAQAKSEAREGASEKSTSDQPASKQAKTDK